MRALVCENGAARLRRDYPIAPRAAGEARIRVVQAGVCATDLQLIAGYKGFSGVLGHEFVGVVEEADNARWIGQRVVGGINRACGQCAPCRRGDITHCAQRDVLGILGRDGAFADSCLLPEANLHAVPDGVSDDQAVFAEPLAAALAITDQHPIAPGERVTVIGDGRLGLLIVQVLALTGCDLTLVGRHAEKLALGEQWGARAGLASEPPVARSQDVVVACSGEASGLALAQSLVRPRGRIILKTTSAAQQGAAELDLNALVVDEVTLCGSRCGPMDAAVRLLAQGVIDVAPLISARFSLDQGEAALTAAARKGVLKVVLQMTC
ncbi:putative alcohol dehydrogenase GroES domain-containing protein [Magnetofaba australis IT-1]|uniref:Putative alcohol dehydrogenase GroES domain-containing protein n=2 Tax=Magnetofaba TaxID=1472292 RepID=A0A1Y2K043_9PROT|nr:putative alcohol dehydrogenase GroES domain-containing protein [Magnetofaba australis IT-1]